MKKTTLPTIVACLLGLLPAASQPFQNLGFESATIVPTGDPFSLPAVQWNPAMPGWTGRIGANPASSLIYNDACLSPCSAMFIFDQPTPFRPLVGRYSVMLSAGLGLAGFANIFEASIAQTALIPADAQSIRFLGIFGGTQPFVVSVAGQALPLYELNVGPDFTAYGADVSAFAGQTAELRFTVATDAASAQAGRGSALVVDAITFSAVPVPEPSAVMLLILAGGAVLGWGFRSRHESTLR